MRESERMISRRVRDWCARRSVRRVVDAVSGGCGDADQKRRIEVDIELWMTMH